MKSLVIGHPSVFGDSFSNDSKPVSLSGLDVFFGLLDNDEPEFDGAKHPHSALIRKKAFSCNFRDLACCMLIYESCVRKSTDENHLYSGFGSEFVGEVIAVGSEVKSLKSGDRVIPCASYPFDRLRTPPGLPSNFSSELFSVFDEEQLIKVPSNIDDATAASLTIAGQTVYSIIRRAAIKKGQSVLITAASSNTSLFAMQVLKSYQVTTVGLTSSFEKIELLKSLGYHEVVISPKIDSKPLAAIATEIGGFDITIDPFYDVYSTQVTDYMNYYSLYFTCGLYQQHPMFKKLETIDDDSLNQNFFKNMLLKNISIIGNCLGTREDLENAIADMGSGKTKLLIDSTFRDAQYGDFVRRSFLDPERLGKVIYFY